MSRPLCYENKVVMVLFVQRDLGFDIHISFLGFSYQNVIIYISALFYFTNTGYFLSPAALASWLSWLSQFCIYKVLTFLPPLLNWGHTTWLYKVYTDFKKTWSSFKQNAFCRFLVHDFWKSHEVNLLRDQSQHDLSNQLKPTELNSH